MKPFAAIFILLLFFCGKTPPTPNPKSYAEDFHILVTSLRELDPMAYKVMDRDTFDARAKSTEERLLTAKSRNEAIYIMQEFMYDLGDSHATITSSYGNLFVDRVLPFKVDILYGRLYVRHNYWGDTTLNGEEIYSIDGVPAKKIIDSVKIFYPNDGRRDIIGFGLPALFNSLYAAFCHEADTFHVSTSKGDFNLPSVKKGEPPLGLLVSYNWRAYTNADPPYRNKLTDDYGYFRFTDFAKEEDGHKIEEEFDQLITDMNSRGIKNLVIDLRYNSGGDPYIAGRMATHFTTQPFPVFERLILTNNRKVTYASYMVRNFAYRFRLAGTRVRGDHREKVKHERGLQEYDPSPNHFDGTVYVITASMTGSAATMLCKYLQDLPNVRFVGSETEGATNYFCAHKHCELTLPNNGIYVTFGMQIVELQKGSSDTQKPTGIIPLNAPLYTIDDIAHARDKEMDWIRNDISANK